MSEHNNNTSNLGNFGFSERTIVCLPKKKAFVFQNPRVSFHGMKNVKGIHQFPEITQPSITAKGLAADGREPPARNCLNGSRTKQPEASFPHCGFWRFEFIAESQVDSALHGTGHERVTKQQMMAHQESHDEFMGRVAG